jgi:hypothetical protein
MKSGCRSCAFPPHHSIAGSEFPTRSLCDTAKQGGILMRGMRATDASPMAGRRLIAVRSQSAPAPVHRVWKHHEHAAIVYCEVSQQKNTRHVIAFSEDDQSKQSRIMFARSQQNHARRYRIETNQPHRPRPQRVHVCEAAAHASSWHGRVWSTCTCRQDTIRTG